jgi:hypothetical protein
MGGSDAQAGFYYQNIVAAEQHTLCGQRTDRALVLAEMRDFFMGGHPANLTTSPPSKKPRPALFQC